MGQEKTKQTKHAEQNQQPKKSFYTKKEKKNRIKDRLIKDTWTHFETEEK